MRSIIVTDDTKFEELQNSWSVLAEKSGIPNIFLTHEWLWTWWRHLKGNRKLFLVTVYEDAQLVGVAPLMLCKEYGFRRLKFISSQFADFEDFIIASDESKREEIIETILKTIYQTKGWDIFRLQGIKESSPNFPVFKRFASGRRDFRVCIQEHQEGAPFLEISQTWEDYSKTLRRKLFTDTKRNTNLLQKEGEIQFGEAKLGGLEDLDRMLDEHFRFHQMRRNSLDTVSVMERKETCDFFRAVARQFLEKGWLRFHWMSVNRDFASAHFGFFYQKHFFYYLPSFNESFKRFSVGRILLLKFLEESFRARVERFDFMAGEEVYKKNFNPAVEKLYFLNVSANCFRGRLGDFALNRIYLSIKKLLGKKW